MTILIDKPIWPFRGERWSHLVSDVSYEELHGFANELGIPRTAFQALQSEPRTAQILRGFKSTGNPLVMVVVPDHTA